MMMNAICYKMKTPVIYNKGTKYEKSCDTFLYRYTHPDDAIAEASADSLNQMLKSGITFHDGLDMTKIERFYINKQEEMY